MSNCGNKDMIYSEMDAELEDEHEFELAITNIVSVLKYQQTTLAPKPEVHLESGQIHASMSGTSDYPQDNKDLWSIKIE